jgi:hypothetical protein
MIHHQRIATGREDVEESALSAAAAFRASRSMTGNYSVFPLVR